MRNCPTTSCTGGGGRREIAFASTWHARERIAFGSVLGILLDCEERDWQRFCEAMSSSAVQQEQLPCARSNYFLNHKSSCSTTSCRRGSVVALEEGSHAGLVDEGTRCYVSMVTDYMISAKLEHFTCMVDLLGHAGQLQEAENLLIAMPFGPDVAAWMALLSTCRIPGIMEMAEHIAKQILEMKPENAAGYVLLLAIGVSLRILNGRKRRKV
ncbi:unnamed protein product [Sphagnum compactum]